VRLNVFRFSTAIISMNISQILESYGNSTFWSTWLSPSGNQTLVKEGRYLDLVPRLYNFFVIKFGKINWNVLFWLTLQIFLVSLRAGNTNWRERLSTVDLLNKLACFFKVKKYFLNYQKQLIETSQYMKVNCTEPSPSVGVPC
jgi:hypothetical protein